MTAISRQQTINHLVSLFEESLIREGLDSSPSAVSEYRGELEDRTDEQLAKEWKVECHLAHILT
jgi:hypothetical protein